MKTTYDVIIIGGGIMGSAAAFRLMTGDTALSLAVVERDPLYTRASTTLSMSNARIQFSLQQNIEISRYAFQVLERFEEEMTVNDISPSISLRREGNLFLADDSGESAARKAFDLQKRLGCAVEWWTPEKIRSRYPIYDPRGIGAGTFSPGDGHFDAYGVLMGYRRKAKFLGADYIEAEAREIISDSGRVAGVRLGSGDTLFSRNVINCAGAWCAEIARTAGIALPVVPIKRQVFALDPAMKPDGPLPLTVLPSGLYFRTESGGLILLGKSMAEDPVGFDFSWDDKRFMEILWPELAEFVPRFDTLKLVRGWAGLYAVNTLDGNAILGEWPELEGFYLANGFSGHGLQQAPAVGRYLSELILEHPPALDLSIFSPERVLANRPLSEGGLV
jgi:FAD-dependent oxidoreductase domain-containing protein 1